MASESPKAGMDLEALHKGRRVMGRGLTTVDHLVRAKIMCFLLHAVRSYGEFITAWGIRSAHVNLNTIRKDSSWLTRKEGTSRELLPR